MLKVLHLLNYLGNGGTEVYIQSLAKKLHNKKCKFYIAYSEDGIGREMFQELGIELINLNMKSPFDVGAAKNLKKICKELSIDVIHTHFLRENYISILSNICGNTPKVINSRHMLFENSKSVILMNKIFTRKNDYIIAVSQSVKDQLISEGISEDKIRLIYTGIDLDEWNSQCTLSFRKEFNILDDELLITSVSRFSEEKGHDFFLDVIKDFEGYVKENNLSIGKYRFVLVGDGILLDSMKEKAFKLGIQDKIIFTGFRRDIKNILKSSDIFISHSKNEAFGISLLEAIAANLPVITTDSGGTKEIINNDFENGILVEFGNKKEMALNLLKLIEDDYLRNKMREKAYEIVKDRFTLDKTAERTYNLYEV
jgi:glycosyltransferase involved in cell wall biosynthesis